MEYSGNRYPRKLLKHGQKRRGFSFEVTEKQQERSEGVVVRDGNLEVALGSQITSFRPELETEV